MLVLTLLVWLAVAPADGVISIPGSRLRLGMTEAQLEKLGQFPIGQGESPQGTTTRQGDANFFGVPCQATLQFRDGRLERATFTASGVSPNALDYVEGQLRRSKLWRECTRYEPGNHSCDWLGAVKIHVDILKSYLSARVEAPVRPWEEEADSSLAAAAAPAPPTPVPPAPAEAPTAPAAATSPERGAEPVAMLPETLRLSLPERNPPSEWPRMVSSPKLVFPEAARQASVQGVVWVLALVDADGSVRSAQVDRGIRELNDAAVAWVSQARFAPCVRDGRPCRFWIRVAARFTLY